MMRVLPMTLGLACMTLGLVAVIASFLFRDAPSATAVMVTAATAEPTPPAPDEDASDGVTLTTLQQHGADLAKPTTITHYLIIPAPADARAAAEALELRGFKIVLERPQGTATAGVVRVLASRAEVPTLEHLRATRTVFKGLAHRYGGLYEGWEAVVVP